jgi:SanA protein
MAVIGCGLLAGAVLAGCNLWVRRSAAPHCHSDMEDVGRTRAALVLGCSPVTKGRENYFFSRRIEAAAALFQSGKVEVLILSGDNSRKNYDEPTAMRDALAREGVPEERMFLDYAGFRTLDSVVRAREVFGQSEFVVVSQRFHNERAVFLARRLGINASGFNARDVSVSSAPRTHLREFAARVRAVWDALAGTRPKFLGPPVDVSLRLQGPGRP